MAVCQKRSSKYTLSIVLAAIVAVGFMSASARGNDETAVASMAPLEIEPIDAPFDMPQFKRPTFPDRTFDIRDFGAVEGGTVKNTGAIKKAIHAASKSGGGTVLVPAGKWLTGAIHLENNVNLHLEKGAVILFSQELKDYLPAVFSRHEGLECYKPAGLIYARGCNNIAVTGEGTLNGQGEPWWGDRNTRKMELDGKVIPDGTGRLKELCAAGVPVKNRVFDGSKGDFLRPSFVNPVECKNVFIEGVTILFGPMWTVNPVYCENVVIRKLHIQTHDGNKRTPNGDGVNPDSCKNVLIEYCEFSTGDDCLAIKSGRADDGLRVGKPCENIVIRHCYGHLGHGGVVIGSETSGGVRNIFIRDCTFNGTDRGLRFKTARGRGSIIENIWAENLKMDDIVKEAILVNTLRYTDRYPAQPVTEKTPTYRNLNFKNIECKYAHQAAISLIGLPEKQMSDLTFKDIKIKSALGVRVQDARDVNFVNIDVTPDKGPVVQLDQSWNITIDNMKFPAGADPFLNLIGKKTKNIKVVNTDLSAAKTDIKCEDGASRNAVTVKSAS